MKTYNVIVVDDHEIFRNGLKLLLNKIENVRVVDEASNGMEFLKIIKKHKADLVFMDINMPILDGIDTTEEVCKEFPELKIIALTTFGDIEFFDKMIYAGVVGYMLKTSELDDFKKAINKVMKGGNYFSEEILANVTKETIIHQYDKQNTIVQKISKREIQILELICKGYSNHKIAEELNISYRTIERHKTNLLLKTETHNTVNLVIFAFKNKLVEI